MNQRKTWLAVAVSACAGLALPVTAWGQLERSLPPRGYITSAYSEDSGWVAHAGDDDQPQIVYSTAITVPGSAFLRLRFSDVVLAGDPAQENTTLIYVTSAQDGEVQRFDSETLAQWSNGTAVFNGDTVYVDIVAHQNVGPSRLRVSEVTSSFIDPFTQRTICGSTDDRALSTDHRNARHWPIGCTAWMFNDANSQFLTAGHCLTDGSDVMQFEVPLSDSAGNPISPPVDKQYPVDGASVQQIQTVIGNDWGYFGVLPNSNTGLMPQQVYGVRYTLSNTAPAAAGQTLRITGYGVTDPPVSNTWNLVQKTHTGAYFGLSGNIVEHRVDTTGGNSGSAIYNNSTGQVIGIHTNAGCDTASNSYNTGTNIGNANLQNALDNPLSACRSGNAAATGLVYVSTDQVNNFGTVNTSTGAFGAVDTISPFTQGLAYNPRLGQFYSIDKNNQLSLYSFGGVQTVIGTVSAAGTINGLAYDFRTNTLYGIIQSSGQLVRISLSTLTASAIGAAGGGTVGGIDFDPFNNVLYGIDDAGGSKLITINPDTGARTVIGALGAGITDCNGLAYYPVTETLYTINAANDTLYTVNKSTGAATAVGSTGGIFGSGFGMAAAYGPGPASTPQPQTLLTNLNAAAGPGTFVGTGATTLFKAAGFTLPRERDYNLATLTIPATGVTGTIAPVIDIRNNTVGGTIAGTFTAPSALATGNNTYDSDLGIRAVAGANYWIRLNQPASPAGSFTWSGSSPSTPPSATARAIGYNFNNSFDSSVRNRLRLTGRPIVISNLNRGAGPGTSVTTSYKASAFTMPTGLDFLFDGAQVSLTTINATPQFEIWSGAALPTTPLYTLNSPVTPSADGEYIYTREQPIRLAAGQKFWLRGQTPSGDFIWRSTSPETAPNGLAVHSGLIFNGNSSTTQNRFAIYGLPIISGNSQIDDAPLGNGTTISTGFTKSLGFTVPASSNMTFYGMQATFDLESGAVPRVSLWSGTSAPTTELLVLDNPDSMPLGRREHKFMAPSPLRLARGQRYWVRVTASVGTFDWPGTSPQTLPTGVATSPTYLLNNGSSSVYNRLSVLGDYAPTCPADFNDDGVVDDIDFVLFAQNYDEFTVPPAYWLTDLNGDLQVDDIDFVIFAAYYNLFVCP